MKPSPESLDRQRLMRAVVALAAMVLAVVTVMFAGRLKNLPITKVGRPAETYAQWIDPKPTNLDIWITGGLKLRTTILFTTDLSGLNVTLEPAEATTFFKTDLSGLDVTLEPAETPLLEPTPEQLQDIRVRLQE